METQGMEVRNSMNFCPMRNHVTGSLRDNSVIIACLIPRNSASILHIRLMKYNMERNGRLRNECSRFTELLSNNKTILLEAYVTPV